jgi:hypothetical protein
MIENALRTLLISIWGCKIPRNTVQYQAFGCISAIEHARPMHHILCPRTPFFAFETNFGHFCRIVFASVEWIIEIRCMTLPGCCENNYLEYASTCTTVSFKVFDISNLIRSVLY